MATPTRKSEYIESFLTAATGLDRRASIVGDTCVFCSVTVSRKAEWFAPGGEVDTFRDEISRREYTISGLCQDCQDKVYPGNDG